MILTFCMAKGQTPKNYNEWKEYFNKNIADVDNIEGIYKATWMYLVYYKGELKTNTIDKNMVNIEPYVVIVKDGDNYKRYVVADNRSLKRDILIKSYSEDKFFMQKEIKTESFMDTPEIRYLKGEFFEKYTFDKKTILDSYVLTNEDNGNKVDRYTLMKMADETEKYWNVELTKIYPTKDVIDKYVNSNTVKTGTGFAISNNGLIVTNFHVIEGANKISIKGVNLDFSNSYTARVLLSDKINDLAILQINEKVNLGTIPYTLKTELSGVGENIYVLGYPLLATMGDEIKLTNGIISSKTGFKGEISSYQTSAPVQPGNSGGPLFDSKGNIIGIINAKHSQAENASYAIKTSCLMNLIELLPEKPCLTNSNLLTNLSLTNQVDKMKKFVFIIEVK